jgi:hypothetical protein
VDDQTALNGANSVAMDDSAWSGGSPAQPSPPVTSGNPNVAATAPTAGNAPSQPQPPAPAGASPAVPSRRFEKPGEFFHAAAHAIGGALLGTMAGPDPAQYTRNDSGALVTTRPATSTSDKLRRIAQAALTGLSAGANAPRRPGADALSGLGAGFTAEQKQLQGQDQQSKQEADENFEEKQKTLLRKHDIMHQNALTVATYFGNLKLKNDLNPMFAENESLMKAAKASPDLAGHVTEMTDSEADAAQQADPHWAADHIVKPLGWAPVLDNEGHQVLDANGDPKEYMRVGVINGATDGTSIAITPEAAAAVQKYGPNAQVSNAENITAGTVIPFQKYISMMNAVDLERKNELQGWAKPEIVYGGKDGKTPMQQNPVTKEVRPMPKDADGNPIIPNVKNLPLESQATVDSKDNKGEVTPRDKFIQDREDKREQLRLAAKTAADKAAANTDVFGNISTLSDKEFNKRYDAFNKSKQYQTLSTLQGSYQQFQQAVRDINSGKPLSGAASVVGLFNAIGISATPLAGKGFRVNENTVREHTDARGLDQKALQKLESLQTGAVITENQLKDYAGIAAQIYKDSFINAANEQRRQLGYVDVLPLGNNEIVDPMTASLYLRIAGGDRAKAETALQKSGWIVPQS